MDKVKIILFAVLAFLSAIDTSWATESEENVYLVGVVPQFDSRRIHATWRPILDMLEQRTGLKFSLRGSATIQNFEQEFEDGVFDFVYMNPYHILKANEGQGYRPLVRDVGQRLYGVVVVRKDSSIQKIEDLDGKLVAFPAPNALGASLMPRAVFKNEYQIKIRAKYVKTHSSVYLNVILGKADAGGGVQKSLDQQRPGIKERLRVIFETSRFAPHPIAAHPRVSEAVIRTVKEELLAMGEMESGKALMSKVPIKQLGSATMADYEPLQQLGLEEFFNQ